MKDDFIFTKAILRRILFSSLILLSVYSCSKGSAQITTDENGNSVINLKNPFGRSITFFSPSAETGSIGVEAAGISYWMKGMPERSKIDKLTTSYTSLYQERFPGGSW